MTIAQNQQEWDMWCLRALQKGLSAATLERDMDHGPRLVSYQWRSRRADGDERTRARQIDTPGKRPWKTQRNCSLTAESHRISRAGQGLEQTQGRDFLWPFQLVG